MYQEHLTFYIHNIHSIKRNTQTCSIVEFNIYCLMKKQYVEGVQNVKEVYLTSDCHIALLFPGTVKDNCIAMTNYTNT